MPYPDPNSPSPQLSYPLCCVAWEMTQTAVKWAAEVGITNKLNGTLVVFTPDSEVPFFRINLIRDADPKYFDIATRKGIVSLRTGLPSSMVQTQYPYLYKEGDTKWGGSTVMPGGVVVAFSGVQAVFDEMIAEWMASAIRALSRNEMTREGGVMASESAIIGES
jgi:hypothetical protein